jgi:hypothetical protein
MLAACQRPAAQAPAANAAPDVTGYLAPPTLTLAARTPDGGLSLSGDAPADAEVRLRDPSGAAFSATANDGAWSMQLPPSSAPRMFAFEGETAGRVLHGEGAILVLPPPGPAAVLTRAGYGALVIGPKAGPLRILTMDYDGGGGGAVSGVTTPHAPVRFMLDDRPAGASQADDKGRFTVMDLSTRAPFGPGAHTIRIESQTSAVQGQLVVTPAASLTDTPFQATRETGAWRADWRIPGGGVQTTIVFDAPADARPPAAPETKP